MSYSSFDINSLFTNRFLLLFYSKLAPTATYLKKKLRMLYFKTGLISRLNNRLITTYLATEGALKHINTDLGKARTKEELMLRYKSARKALKFFRDLHYTFESVNFFTSAETKELSENILSNLYDIEASLRQKAFSDENVPEDKYLTDISSSLSINAFSN